MHNELTKVDIKKMQEEIEYRKYTLGPQLKENLKTAREMGDLSENDEYKTAKRELGRNNSRIRYLQMMIDTAVIVNTDSAEGVVGLFCKVTLFIEEDNEDMEILLATTLRQDSLKNVISKESPLGKAIFGKKVGDRVKVVVNDSYSYYVVIKKVIKCEDDESLKISAY